MIDEKTGWICLEEKKPFISPLTLSLLCKALKRKLANPGHLSQFLAFCLLDSKKFNDWITNGKSHSEFFSLLYYGLTELKFDWGSFVNAAKKNDRDEIIKIIDRTDFSAAKMRTAYKRIINRTPELKNTFSFRGYNPAWKEPSNPGQRKGRKDTPLNPPYDNSATPP